MPLLDSDNQEISTKPRFDFSTAEPLKSVPQLSEDRKYRYRRPMSEYEHALSTADLYKSEHPEPKGNILKQAVEGEQHFMNLHTPEFAGAVDTLLGGGVINMFAGIASGKEKPASTGKAGLDILNFAHDNALRGLFEPSITDVTGISLLKQYPNMNGAVAGALGTAAEIGALMIVNPIGSLNKGINLLSKEAQNELFFNKVTQSSEWGDNIMAVSKHLNIPWEKVAKDAQRHLWDAINKGNYFQVLMKNLELYKPFQLRGLTVEDVGGVSKVPDESSTLKPTVKSGDKTEIGKDHEEALRKFGMSKDTHVEGKDFVAGFTTPSGDFITREQSMKPPYNLKTGHSEDIPEQSRIQAVQSEQFVPYEFPAEVSPKKYVSMRNDYLENQSNMIDSQMRDLEGQKTKMQDLGMSTGRIDKKLDKLGKQWKYTDSLIAENMIGQVKIDDIRNQIGQAKVDSIIKFEATAEEKGYGEGFRKGITSGKEKGRLKEAQRQSELRTFAKYKEIAKQEVHKMAKQIKALNSNLLPLEYKRMLEDLISNFDLNRRTPKTLWSRGEAKKYLEEAKARGEQVNIPEDLLKTLEQTSLNDMTVQELRDLHEAVMRLYGQGRLKNKLKILGQERELEATVQQGKEAILRGEALTPESQIVKMIRKRDLGLVKMSNESLKYYILNWRRPEAMINQLDSGDPSGINTEMIWDPINTSDNLEQQLKEVTDKKIEEIFGFQDTERYHDKFQIGGIELTKSDMMTIYASSGNAENRAHILAMGFKDNIFDEVDRILSEDEKSAVKKYWQFQNDRFPEINKKAFETEGHELKQVERRFPIMNLAKPDVEGSPDEVMQAEYEYRKSITNKFPTMAKNFLKERTGSELPLRDLNFFGTIYKDMDRQNHYLSFVDSVKNVNKYLNHPDIRQAIIQKFGEQYHIILNKWLRDAALGKIPEHSGVASNFSRFTRTKLASSYLGYNFLTTAKQLLGILPGMEMAGKSATMAFIPRFFSNPSKYIDIAINKSSMMKHRAMRQEREFEEFKQMQDSLSRMKTEAYDKLIQYSLAPTLFTDRIISTIIWNAVYDGRKDLSEELRIKEADRIVRRTQPMGGVIHLPHIFRDPSEIAKQATWLKGHTNKFFNLEQDMFENKANGRDSNAKFISQVLFYTILPATGLFFIENKRLQKSPSEWAISILEQRFIGIWGLSELMRLMGNHYQNFTSTPAESYLREFYAVFGSKKPSTRVKKAVEFAGMNVGFPIVGTERLLAGKPFGQSNEPKKKERNSLNLRQKGMFDEMIKGFDKGMGYKRKKKNTGVTE